MSKLKVSTVSYLNTKPFIYGLEHSDLINELDLRLDIPSECARKLLEGEVDLALVPVSIYRHIPNAKLFTDYCIGASGEVQTVCLLAERPIEELSRIYLDYHSRTSKQLLNILLKEYWNLDIELIHAQEGFEDEIGGKSGALIIGDRCISLRNKYPYVYDLGQAWKSHTGLDFVFAVWLSRVDISDYFVGRFNQALKAGLNNIDKVIGEYQVAQTGFDLKDYFTRYIKYDFDDSAKAGMELFMNKLKEHADSLPSN